MAGLEILEARCSGYRNGIITWIGPVEQGYYESCTGVICKKLV